MDSDDDRATSAEIQRARETYVYSSDNTLEIDEEAAASRGEGGVWVAAWVWLKNQGDEL